jgi:hypothetical protein
MYAELIEKIDRIQRERLSHISLKPNGHLDLHLGPRTRVDGMYWIYTDHTNDELIASIPADMRGAIDFCRSVRRHCGNERVCKTAISGFRVVYSGIGGVGEGGEGGLRERILGEFRGGNGTGSLAIRKSSLSDLTRWRYSYVLWDELEELAEYSYRPFATALEGLWRLHFGWPLLCSK